jgi:hypothetical protein
LLLLLELLDLLTLLLELLLLLLELALSLSLRVLAVLHRVTHDVAGAQAKRAADGCAGSRMANRGADYCSGAGTQHATTERSFLAGR